jgi:hypothetical protein
VESTAASSLLTSNLALALASTTPAAIINLANRSQFYVFIGAYEQSHR